MADTIISESLFLNDGSAVQIIPPAATSSQYGGIKADDVTDTSKYSKDVQIDSNTGKLKSYNFSTELDAKYNKTAGEALTTEFNTVKNNVNNIYSSALSLKNALEVDSTGKIVSPKTDCSINVQAATANNYGAVKAIAATDAHTGDVAITESGLLKVKDYGSRVSTLEESIKTKASTEYVESIENTIDTTKLNKLYNLSDALNISVTSPDTDSAVENTVITLNGNSYAGLSYKLNDKEEVNTYNIYITGDNNVPEKYIYIKTFNYRTTSLSKNASVNVGKIDSFTKIIDIKFTYSSTDGNVTFGAGWPLRAHVNTSSDANRGTVYVKNISSSSCGPYDLFVTVQYIK